MESTNKKVIAICSNGHGAGKTTLAEFIVDAAKRLRKKQGSVGSFAEKLKNMCAYDLVSDYNVMYDERKDQPNPELNGVTPRDVLIAVGTALKNTCGEDILTKLTLKEIKDDLFKDYADFVVIDDLRFPYELEALKEEYGDDLYTIYLEGNPDEMPQDLSTEGLMCPGDCNTLFNNYGSLGLLYDCAILVVESVWLN